MATTTITVKTTQELYAALSKCTGGETILLEGGDYGRLDIHQYMKPPMNMNLPSTVTITSADPSDPAVFSGVKVTGASNLSFEDVTFDYTFKPTDPVWVQPFVFSNCDGLVIRDCTFDGDLATGTGRSSDDGYGYGKALTISGSRDVLVEGNEIYDFYRGVEMTRNTDVVVRSNEIYEMRSDGMTFSQMDGILIEDNYIHDFRSSPTSTDHPDMIQFWTAGTTAPTKDVIIRDNILDIGNGTATQSIFMRNDMVDTGKASFASMAYRNILIENNTITNAHAWGINVGEAIGVTVKQNTVVHADGGNVDGADSTVEIPKIHVAPASTGVSVTGNVTSAVSGWTNQVGWTVASNVFVQDQDPHAAGYYANVFASSSLQPGADGSHHYMALIGSIIDTLNAGSSSTQPQTTGLQVMFHMDQQDAATRVFDASLSTLNGSALPAGTTYTWTFGDGTTATGSQVAHSYATGGDYTVKLTVVLPSGVKASEVLAVDVQSPDILTMNSSCAFTAYENGLPIALGVAKNATSDGIQLGASGVAASVARTHVADVAGADDVTIAFTLDADKAGTSGELFRLHGSFVVAVTKTGELQVAIMRDGASTLTCVTKGAGLNSAVNVDHDVVINLDNGKLQIWVDGQLDGQMAVPGVMGGSVNCNSQNLTFGNPWGQANFNGDISGFEISVGAGDFPPKPVTQVVVPKMPMAPDSGIVADTTAVVTTDQPATSEDQDGTQGPSEASARVVHEDSARDRLVDMLEARLDAFASTSHEGLDDGVRDRFVALLEARLDAFAA